MSNVSLHCRDTLIYATSSSIDGLPFVVDLLSEVVLRPQITDQEVNEKNFSSEFIVFLLSFL